MQSLERLHQMPQGNGFFSFTRGNSRGFFDVLCSFAQGIGYTVDPCANIGNRAGQIDYRRRHIEVNRVVRDDLIRAAVMAHEISHEYTSDIYSIRYQTRRIEAELEQVTEAVSALIMDEYGFDTHTSSRDYIDAQSWMYG